MIWSTTLLTMSQTQWKAYFSMFVLGQTNPIGNPRPYNDQWTILVSAHRRDFWRCENVVYRLFHKGEWTNVIATRAPGARRSQQAEERSIRNGMPVTRQREATSSRICPGQDWLQRASHPEWLRWKHVKMDWPIRTIAGDHRLAPPHFWHNSAGRHRK